MNAEDLITKYLEARWPMHGRAGTPGTAGSSKDKGRKYTDFSKRRKWMDSVEEATVADFMTSQATHAGGELLGLNHKGQLAFQFSDEKSLKRFERTFERGWWRKNAEVSKVGGSLWQVLLTDPGGKDWEEPLNW